MASYRTNGVPPKPESKRRRRNKPASYGAARPTTAPAAEPTTRELGIDGAHPLVQDMWNMVQHSCEAAFYSETDWERLRPELWLPTTRWPAAGRPVRPGQRSSTGSTRCCCRRRSSGEPGSS